MAKQRPGLRQTTSEAVATALREEILAGEHRPGERLRQDRIAKRLGVSITPVREAFALLRTEGLLYSGSHRGVQVFAPTAGDLLELYAMRTSLERLAVGRAAARIDAQTLAALGALVESMNADPDHSDYFTLNKRFHSMLYGGAGSPRLTACVDALRDSSDVYLHLFVLEFDPEQMWAIRHASDADHQAILTACSVGDGAAAEDLIEYHLQRTLEAVLDLLRARKDLPG